MHALVFASWSAFPPEIELVTLVTEDDRRKLAYKVDKQNS
jgi:hypothetical protein